MLQSIVLFVSAFLVTLGVALVVRKWSSDREPLITRDMARALEISKMLKPLGLAVDLVDCSGCPGGQELVVVCRRCGDHPRECECLSQPSRALEVERWERYLALTGQTLEGRSNRADH